MRVGIGYDSHRFAPDRRLILGGVEIEHDQGLEGHSDADVLTHAVIDALLGAGGLGDLGAHFPPDESPFRGLPGDRCQCDHWGYLIAGSFRVTYRDADDEVVQAGEAYHLRPGHFVQTLEPTELIEFSPVHEHDKTMSVVMANVFAESAS